MEGVKAAFGSDPMITTEGDSTELFYAIGSQNNHDLGMRICSIKVIFGDDKFSAFEFGLVRIGD